MNLDLLSSRELVIFTTRDFARLAEISLAAASKRLTRLAAANTSLVQLTRGVWANRAHPYFNVLACVPVLLGSEQGYVSFLSALHLHGAIAQIPANVQVATDGAFALGANAGRYVRAPSAQARDAGRRRRLERFAAALPHRDGRKGAARHVLHRDAQEAALRETPELNLDDAGFKKQRYRALVAALQLPPPIATAMARRWDGIATHATGG